MGRWGRGWLKGIGALQRSLMYGLIWASTVATARLVGPGFTKLMAHIKTAEKFRFMLPTGPRGESTDSIFFHFWLVLSFYAFIKPRAAVSVAFFIEGGWDFFIPLLGANCQNSSAKPLYVFLLLSIDDCMAKSKKNGGVKCVWGVTSPWLLFP